MKRKKNTWFLYVRLVLDVYLIQLWTLRLKFEFKQKGQEFDVILSVYNPTQKIVTIDAMGKKYQGEQFRVVYTFVNGKIFSRISDRSVHKKLSVSGKLLIVDIDKVSDFFNPSHNLSGAVVLKSKEEILKPYMYKHAWDPEVLGLEVPDNGDGYFDVLPHHKKNILEKLQDIRESFRLSIKLFKESKKKKKDDTTWLYRNVKTS
jgi:hypothetical protein